MGELQRLMFLLPVKPAGYGGLGTVDLCFCILVSLIFFFSSPGTYGCESLPGSRAHVDSQQLSPQIISRLC